MKKYTNMAFGLILMFGALILGCRNIGDLLIASISILFLLLGCWIFSLDFVQILMEKQKESVEREFLEERKNEETKRL